MLEKLLFLEAFRFEVAEHVADDGIIFRAQLLEIHGHEVKVLKLETLQSLVDGLVVVDSHCNQAESPRFRFLELP